MYYCLILIKRIIYILCISKLYLDFWLQALLEHQSWDRLHHIGDTGSSCTCLAVNRVTGDVATAGEDGRINLLALDQATPVKTIGNIKQ